MTNMTEFLCLLVQWCLRRPDRVEVWPGRSLYGDSSGASRLTMSVYDGGPSERNNWRMEPWVSVWSGSLNVVRARRVVGRVGTSPEAVSRELAELAGDCGR